MFFKDLLHFDRLALATAKATDEVVLPFDLRQKSRLRVVLKSGREAAVTLERGHVLRDGDQLSGPGGEVVRVLAAAEHVSTARSADPRTLARVAYHLGNRHVPLQVGDGWVRYQHDHVLDDMCRAVGVAVDAETAPFEPEAGAYGKGHITGHGDAHAHDHDHAQGHSHGHAHGHPHDHGKATR